MSRSTWVAPSSVDQRLRSTGRAFRVSGDPRYERRSVTTTRVGATEDTTEEWFRARVSAFLDEHATRVSAAERDGASRTPSDAEMLAAARANQASLFDAGL